MGETRTVMVVEDQELLREAVAFEFEMLGFEQIMAENGLVALEKYQNHPVDLIVSDIQMPVCGGRKFLCELRKLAPTSPPFVFMTGFSDFKCYDAFNEGADGMISKPINTDRLGNLVKTLSQPLNKRWEQKPAEAMAHQIDVIASSKACLQAGRLGVFVSGPVLGSLETMQESEMIGFNLKNEVGDFPDIEGAGVIRWVRTEALDGLEPGIGVEIAHLQAESLSRYLEYLGKNQKVATIPRGDTAGT